MRGCDFMNETGFIWATDTWRGAKGKKVQWRFEHSSSFVPVGGAEPSIQEIMEYVMPISEIVGVYFTGGTRFREYWWSM